ncbi:MAG TPA: hypothetical protein VKB89_27265 [Xanthobacteraceae bacterium]|nr:hypothetical protein [Xanthobacteraceae bacterium]
MKLPRRNFLRLAAGAAALPAMSQIAWAQAYPSRPVRIVVGFPAGGRSVSVGQVPARLAIGGSGAGLHGFGCRARLKNESRTGCYRFATQLSVTGRDRRGQQ